jgi:hypothetical protein
MCVLCFSDCTAGLRSRSGRIIVSDAFWNNCAASGENDLQTARLSNPSMRGAKRITASAKTIEGRADYLKFPISGLNQGVDGRESRGNVIPKTRHMNRITNTRCELLGWDDAREQSPAMGLRTYIDG